MLKKAVFLLISAVISTGIYAEKKSEITKGDTSYVFTKIYDNAHTSVKDQNSSGTCWSFSALSFIESELLRNGKDIDLAEMYVVRHTYFDKAEYYFRMHGSSKFGQGGNFNDIIYVWKKYGLVPENIYRGLNYGEDNHRHGEISALLKSYIDVIIKKKNRTKVSTAWKMGYNGILDAYFGKEPTTFKYKGKDMSPRKFADKVMGLNPDDYIQLTSYTHKPFFKPFIMQIPDNWTLCQAYNVPLKDLEKITNHVLKVGGTIGWAADVSEKGFSFKKGLALIPADTKSNVDSDTERAKWDTMKQKDKDKLIYTFKKPIKEKTITQEMRQIAYDNYQTTDDHGMHIIGSYKDQNGKLYYKVKNSWTTNNKYDGYFYASKSYYDYKTMSIMINKNDLPKDIKTKLGL